MANKNLNKMERTVKDLKEIIKDLPDDTVLKVIDPEHGDSDFKIYIRTPEQTVTSRRMMFFYVEEDEE